MSEVPDPSLRAMRSGLIQLGDIYNKIAKQEFRRCLALAMETNPVNVYPIDLLNDANDSVKNMANHLFKAGQSEDTAEIAKQFREGHWHLNHARAHVLIPTLVFLEVILDQQMKWASVSHGPVLTSLGLPEKIVSSAERHAGLYRRYQADILKGGPTDEPRPPEEDEMVNVTALVTEMAALAESLEEMILTMHQNVPGMPSFRDIVADL